MTDKQIIIDGVDVSGCKHYKNRTCIADYCLTDMPFGEAKCELNPNCYYKQLKRKEQECENNKIAHQMELDIYNQECLNLQEELKAKEQECEELKIYIESNEQQVKEVETLVMDNDRLINELDQLKEQLEGYKMEAEEGKEINAELKAENEELKEILNEGCLHNLTLMTEQRVLLQTLTEIKELLLKTPTDSPMHCINAKSVILQKISECEGNDG